MRAKVLFLSVLISGLLAPSRGEAADNLFQQAIGAGCVPASETIRNGLHHTAGFGIKFEPNRTGTIRLFCPFPQPEFGTRVGGLQLSVIDTDGMNINARVRVNLRFANRGSNVSVTVGTCDSNISNNTGPQALSCPIPVHVMQFGRFYWYEVLMDRFSPGVDVEFLGVSPLVQI